MIRHRRKKGRRKVSPHLDLPASDFILYRENRNPYRKGTAQADAYDAHYNAIAAQLTSARHLQQQRRQDDTGPRRGPS